MNIVGWSLGGVIAREVARDYPDSVRQAVTMGTPVVGGLTTDRALKILRGLSALNIVAADVVEVAPAYDSADITSLAAASLSLEYLYLFADNKGE